MSEQENILTPEEIDAITEGVKDGSIDVDLVLIPKLKL